jgi:hypothetical protein
VNDSRDMAKEKDKLEKVVSRAKKESNFKQQIKKDPLGVLEEAGVSPEAIGDFLREQGYARRAGDPELTEGEKKAIDTALACWDECCFTCFFTDCPITRL